jgi:chemotaxis response regulator CheB
MTNRAIFVGASAGGVEALKDLVRELPEKFSVPIFVVLHVAPYVASFLPEILAKMLSLMKVLAETIRGNKIAAPILRLMAMSLFAWKYRRQSW